MEWWLILAIGCCAILAVTIIFGPVMGGIFFKALIGYFRKSSARRNQANYNTFAIRPAENNRGNYYRQNPNSAHDDIIEKINSIRETISSFVNKKDTPSAIKSLRKWFRDMANLWHPDHNRDRDTTQICQNIIRFYELAQKYLKDTENKDAFNNFANFLKKEKPTVKTEKTSPDKQTIIERLNKILDDLKNDHRKIREGNRRVKEEIKNLKKENQEIKEENQEIKKDLAKIKKMLGLLPDNTNSNDELPAKPNLNFFNKGK